MASGLPFSPQLLKRRSVHRTHTAETSEELLVRMALLTSPSLPNPAFMAPCHSVLLAGPSMLCSPGVSAWSSCSFDHPPTHPCLLISVSLKAWFTGYPQASSDALDQTPYSQVPTPAPLVPCSFLICPHLPSQGPCSQPPPPCCRQELWLVPTLLPAPRTGPLQKTLLASHTPTMMPLALFLSALDRMLSAVTLAFGFPLSMSVSGLHLGALQPEASVPLSAPAQHTHILSSSS